MSEPRTFSIKKTPMKGKDIESWEKEMIELFARIGIRAPIVTNGVYSDYDRSYTRSLVYAYGLDPNKALEHGVTPELRTKLRNRNFTDREKHVMSERVAWRTRLRLRYRRLEEEEQGDVSLFIKKLITDKWGYKPGVHDGIDLISLPDVPIFAPVKCRVFDVRPNGWWRLGAPANRTLREKGDGIVQLEILEDVGPFEKGYHIGLGHAEHAKVKEGDIVQAGDEVAHTGFANAWHIHLVYNDGSTTMGIGNRDPRAIVDYSIKHG